MTDRAVLRHGIRFKRHFQQNVCHTVICLLVANIEPANWSVMPVVSDITPHPVTVYSRHKVSWQSVLKFNFLIMSDK